VEQEYIPCNLCGADDTSPWLEGKAGCAVICNRCGLIYVNPRPKFEETQEHYNENYAEYFIQRAPSKLRRAGKILKGINKRKKPPGRFLDIGCNAGFILKTAADLGWEAFGVEPSAPAAEYARETYGLDVKNCILEEAGYKDGFFDVITTFNVIEHVSDPMGHFREIRRIMKDDGLLLIWTPNASHPKARRNRAGYFMLDHIEHLYYFHRSVMYDMLDRAGLRFAGLAGLNLKPGMKIYARKKL